MQSATSKSRPQDSQGKGAANKQGEIETTSVLLSANQMLLVPTVFTLVLFLISFLPRIQSNDTLVISFWGACAALLLWAVVLYSTAVTSG